MAVSSFLTIEPNEASTTVYADIAFPCHYPLKCPDTPKRLRITDNAEFNCSFVKLQRRALTEYIGGQVCAATVGYFFSRVLPPILPQFNIERIYGYCIDKGFLKIPEECEKYVWSDFLTNPGNDTKHETAVFRPLKKIFKYVTDAVKQTQKNGVYCPAPTTYLHVDGNTASWSENDSYLKPDGHVYLKNGEPGNPKHPNEHNWYNSVFILQFKKQRCNRYQVK